MRELALTEMEIVAGGDWSWKDFVKLVGGTAAGAGVGYLLAASTPVVVAAVIGAAAGYVVAETIETVWEVWADMTPAQREAALWYICTGSHR